MAYAVNVRADDYTKEDVKKFTAMLNSQLPIPIGNAIIFQSSTVVKDTVRNELQVHNYGELMPEAQDFDFLDYLITQETIMVQQNEDTRLWFEMIAEAGMYFQMVAKNKDKILYVLTLSPAQIDEILEGEPDYEKVVRYNVLVTKSTVPADAGGGLTMIDSYIKDQGVYTVAEIDENKLSIDIFDPAVMKNGLIMAIKQGSDPTMSYNFLYNAFAGYDSVLRYIGSKSKKTVDVILTPDDVINAFENSPLND